MGRYVGNLGKKIRACGTTIRSFNGRVWGVRISKIVCLKFVLITKSAVFARFSSVLFCSAHYNSTTLEVTSLAPQLNLTSYTATSPITLQASTPHTQYTSTSLALHPDSLRFILRTPPQYISSTLASSSYQHLHLNTPAAQYIFTSVHLPHLHPTSLDFTLLTPPPPSTGIVCGFWKCTLSYLQLRIMIATQYKY